MSETSPLWNPNIVPAVDLLWDDKLQRELSPLKARPCGLIHPTRFRRPPQTEIETAARNIIGSRASEPDAPRNAAAYLNFYPAATAAWAFDWLYEHSYVQVATPEKRLLWALHPGRYGNIRGIEIEGEPTGVVEVVEAVFLVTEQGWESWGTREPLSSGDAHHFTPFIPSPLQERILEALDKKSLTLDALAVKLGSDRSALHRDGIKELAQHGLVKNHKRVGGYYRPDAPPSKYASLLGDKLGGMK